MVAVQHALQQLTAVQVGRACAVFRVVIQLRHVSLSGVSLKFYGSGTFTPPGLSRASAAVGLGFLVLVRGFSTIIDL